MKSLYLLFALLITPGLRAEISNEDAMNKENISAQNASAASASHLEYQDEDPFDILMNTDIPSGIIVMPKPVTPLEAYFKHIGVSLLMQYIAMKIWLQHHWHSLTGSSQ